ncbi:putative geranylgeranyl transferase type-2 subunit alpha [Triangularia setosa]|uniref:Geranylgeranyl transferase type-2 subunit alpha n=1 Tax=Triangularia setosa TaxID=2587417 RepID=A0AAN6WB38_9PEZI|nr:putative geranylgeranyl transferase type-2 subunit alpha [Podospora setosa]
MVLKQGGSQHGIARTSRVRTEAQKQQDLERIQKYRDLESHLRKLVSASDYSCDTFDLTTKLLKLNPEYYTAWNVRRRTLISGLFSRRSDGSSCWRGCSSSSRCDTTTTCSAASLSSSLTRILPSRAYQTTGRSGTTADQDVSDAATPNDTTTPTPEDEESQKKDSEIIKSELFFTIPLLLESPKCYWIWSYRLWILGQSVLLLPVPIAKKIWQEELGLASKMLAKDCRNFHAWGYRRHVVSRLESKELGGESLVESEFAYTDRMIRGDLSNFSAWHSRSKLIPRLLNERVAGEKERKGFLDAELNQIREALNVGPEDQSLWYYHQFLIDNLVSPVGRPTIVPTLTVEERVMYLTNEITEIKDLLEDYKDVKLIYEALLEYTLGLCQLIERKPEEDERQDLISWVKKLKELDPMRMGRWIDLERDSGLTELLPGWSGQPKHY